MPEKRGWFSPYNVANFFFGIVITRIWVDPKHNVHLIASDFHPLHQRPDEVPLGSCSHL